MADDWRIQEKNPNGQSMHYEGASTPDHNEKTSKDVEGYDVGYDQTHHSVAANADSLVTLKTWAVVIVC